MKNKKCNITATRLRFWKPEKKIIRKKKPVK
jgi:hypothetical protein